MSSKGILSSLRIPFLLLWWCLMFWGISFLFSSFKKTKQNKITSSVIHRSVKMTCESSWAPVRWLDGNHSVVSSYCMEYHVYLLTQPYMFDIETWEKTKEASYSVGNRSTPHSPVSRAICLGIAFSWQMYFTQNVYCHLGNKNLY